MGLVDRWAEWIRGYVVFRVTGGGIERFANLAAGEGVPLWSFRRLGTRVAVGRAYASDFRRLRGPARKAAVQLRTVRRGGLPFLWRRVRRRPGLVAGAALAVALVMALGARVWEVRVYGVADEHAQQIREALAGMGLRPGAARSALDLRAMERELLVRLPSLAWAQVRLRGSVAVVEARLRRDGGSQVLETGDIVATHDGLVTQLFAAAGAPVVQIGEVVRRGQVLIRGHPGAGATPSVRAAGWVRARVWAEGYGEARPYVEVDRPAGPEVRGWLVEVGPWRFHLGAVTPPAGRFRSRVDVYRMPGPAALLPLRLQFVRHQPLQRLRVPLQLEIARRLAEEAALERAAEELGREAEVLRVLRQTWEEPAAEGEGLVRSRVLVEAVLDIGRFQPHRP